MAYDEKLAERVRMILARRKGIAEKKMFGGLSFLLNGKMCCGVLKDNLVVRVDPKEGKSLLEKPHVHPMDFTGRPLRGFLYVSSKGYKTDKMLEAWIDRGTTYAKVLKSK